METTDLHSRKNDRLSPWLQFLRRVVFQLLAFGLFMILIALVRTSLGTQASGLNTMTDELPVRAANTWRIVGIAGGISLLFSMVTLLIAYYVLRAEAKGGFWGSLLRALGRLWIFSDISLPVFALGLFMMWIFAIRLELLPVAGMFDPSNDTPSDRLLHMVLPVLALVFMPAGFSALAAARRMVSSADRGGRCWAGGILRLVAALFRQVGGIISAIIALEMVFSWPGIGRTLVQAIVVWSFPVFFTLVIRIAWAILAARLLAELFDWLACIIDPQTLAPAPPEKGLNKRRLGWRIFTLALLGLVVLFVAYGTLIGSDAASAIDPQNKLADPSPAHLLGTDMLGRDTWSRIAHGTAVTFWIALAAAMLVTLVAFPLGVLAGWLTRKRRWWADLLADLVLLPADAGLFLPALVSCIVLLAMRMSSGDAGMPPAFPMMLVFWALLPRLVRFAMHAWVDAPDGRVLRRVLGSLFSLLLAGVFAGFSVLTAFAFLQMLPPTSVTLGAVLAESWQYVMRAPASSVIIPIMILWFFLGSFFLAAEAQLEGWLDKRAFSWLNS